MKWARSGMLDELVSIPKEQILCFDTETTGIDPENCEILQLTICDGNGEVLFSSYLKPLHAKTWSKAQAVNGISPAMVKDAPTIPEVLKEIKEVFRRGKLIVGYNVGFDLDFMRAAGVVPVRGSKVFDVMYEFADLRAIPDERHGGNKWFKLGEAAQYYGYEFSAHDAAKDTAATLFVFDRLLEDEQYQALVQNSSTKPASTRQDVVPKKKLSPVMISLIAVVLGFLLCGLTGADSMLFNVGMILFFGGIIAVVVMIAKKKKKKN